MTSRAWPIARTAIGRPGGSCSGNPPHPAPNCLMIGETWRDE